MMRIAQITTFLFLLASSSGAWSQIVLPCNCPKNDYGADTIDTVFSLANGSRIALCGYREENSNPPEFSEFILSVCGTDSIIAFWDATETCLIQVQGSALVVKSLDNLPLGSHMRYKPVPWYIETISVKQNLGIRSGKFSNSIPKYSSSQISKLLLKYDALKGHVYPHSMAYADELFVAAISGSIRAKKRLLEFRSKWLLDGALLERYDELMAMLDIFDDRRVGNPRVHQNNEDQ
jgi:hypothetical protein